MREVPPFLKSTHICLHVMLLHCQSLTSGQDDVTLRNHVVNNAPSILEHVYSVTIVEYIKMLNLCPVQ